MSGPSATPWSPSSRPLRGHGSATQAVTGADAPVLFLAGDVMTGRGIDQVLPHPGDPRLWESFVEDARRYVSLAETRSGRVPSPVPFAWPWGDALEAVDEVAPAARVINLETSITRSDEAAQGKEVLYRMNPANTPCVTAFRPDVCILANNHVLDFGRAGLLETLGALKAAGLRWAGAGTEGGEAHEPAAITMPDGGRILVAATGAASSGIPASWAATADAPGIAFLEELSPSAADEISARACRDKRAGDVVVVSIHWGSNWGYEVTPAQVRFAHRLVEGGVDVVHGHSSHHPRPIELYRGKLILYGCGDLINDYEGIGGYEEFRGDLRLLYFASVDRGSGRLTSLAMMPMQVRRMRLQRACLADCRWLRRVLQDASRRFSTRIEQEEDGTLVVRATEPSS